MRIVITGPESSGKTTLCQDLSLHYKGRMIPEYARSYLNSKEPQFQYTKEDIIHMALMQNKLSMSDNFKKIQFEDTDLINHLVWSELKFNILPEDIVNLLHNSKPDLYLLCFPDLPWTFDNLRESKNNLVQIFKKHLSIINKLKCNYAIINGIGRQRFNLAKKNVNKFLICK